MASNYTENYGLCQWEATDQVLRTDFNEDNAKVDAALKEQAETLSNLSATRNAIIYSSFYRGNGQTSMSFTFPGKPILINIMGMEHWVCAVQGASIGSGRYLSGEGCQKLNVSWSDNSVTISSPNSDVSYMCNWDREIYRIAAVLDGRYM